MKMTSRTRRFVARAGIWLLSPGSGCSGRDLLAPAGICLLRPGSACPGRDLLAPAENCLLPPRICLLPPANRRLGAESVGSASAALPPRRIRPREAWHRLLGGPPRPLRPRAVAFAAGIVRSASHPATSAAALPARVPRCSRRRRHRRRRNSSAGFRNRTVGFGARSVRSALDPLPPEPDSSSRELIRCLRIRSIASGVGFVRSRARYVTSRRLSEGGERFRRVPRPARR
jgi:hypothetical protein